MFADNWFSQKQLSSAECFERFPEMHWNLKNSNNLYFQDFNTFQENVQIVEK